MGRRRQLAMVAVSAAALVGITSSVSQGGTRDSTRTTATAQFVKNPIRGTVQAVQRGTSRRARVFVSLHGLEPNTDYLVVSSNWRCSQGVVDAADYVVWRSSARSERDDLFGRTRVGLGGSLSTARSVRIFEGDAISTAASRACISVDVWEHA